MNKIFTFLSLIFLSSCVSVQKYNAHIDKKIDVKQLHQDIDYTKDKLLTRHVDIDMYYSKEVIANRFDSFRNTVQQPMFPNDFSKELSKVIASLGHGHTVLSYLQKKSTKEEKKKFKKSQSPFSLVDLKSYDGRLYLDKNRSKDTALVKSGEVLSIDGISFKDYYKENVGIRKGDGFITTFDGYALGNYYTAFVRNTIGLTDSIELTMVKNDSIFTQTIKREYTKKVDKKHSDVKKDSTKIVKQHVEPKKKLTKEEKKIAKEKREHDVLVKKYFAYNKSKKSYLRELKFPNPEDSTTAVFQIKTFSVSHGKKAYPFIFDSIKKRNIHNLVLDLRDNTGGYVSDINYLYSFLTSRNEQQMVTSDDVKVSSKYTMVNKYFRKPNVIGYTVGLPFVLYGSVKSLFNIHKKDDNYYLDVKKKKAMLNQQNKYNGNLYVLTNGLTYSASSIISASLQNEGKAIFVGEETGGDYNGTVAGQFIDFKLPNSKVRLNMGIMTYKPNNGRTLKGRGVIPAVPINRSFEDLINKKDPQLDWILNDIKTKK